MFSLVELDIFLLGHKAQNQKEINNSSDKNRWSPSLSCVFQLNLWFKNMYTYYQWL